ncbi:MAG: sigma-70 family RNA polymerase sigma factor [Phycisphaerales bacterium]|jgi:RNA polymerase sigma factor (TIGR02999 family)
MSDGDAGDVTMMLQAAAQGDHDSAARLLPLVYEELRKLAAARLARVGSGNTLQPTALVHEVYLKLVGKGDPGWEGRRHFFGAAAQAMRDVLVDQARRKGRIKHGGDRDRVELDEAEAKLSVRVDDMVELDAALKRLEADDPRKGQIVNLRFFAGLTAEQTAEALGVSLGTVERDWRYIKAWLYAELSEIEGRGGGS